MDDYNKRANSKYSQFLSENLSLKSYDEVLGSYYPDFIYQDFIDDIISSDSFNNIISSLTKEIEISPSMKYRKRSIFIVNYYQKIYGQPIKSGYNLAYYNIDEQLWLDERFSPGAILSCVNYVKNKSFDKSFLDYHRVSSKHNSGCMSMLLLFITTSSILALLNF